MGNCLYCTSCLEKKEPSIPSPIKIVDKTTNDSISLSFDSESTEEEEGILENVNK